MARALPSLTIGAARVPAPLAAQRPLAKSDLARALAPVSDRPALASDILLVRKLSMPEPASGAAVDKAVVSALTDQRRRAARPHLGRVPEDADAVVFANEAELLACLIVAGRARPWWRICAARILGDVSAPAPLSGVLAERASHLPAVVTQVARWDALSVFEAQFSDVDIIRMTNALIATWDLPLHPTVGQSSAGSPKSNETSQRSVLPSVPSRPKLRARSLVRVAQDLATSPLATKTRLAQSGTSPHHLAFAAGAIDAPPRPEVATVEREAPRPRPDPSAGPSPHRQQPSRPRDATPAAIPKRTKIPPAPQKEGAINQEQHSADASKGISNIHRNPRMTPHPEKNRPPAASANPPVEERAPNAPEPDVDTYGDTSQSNPLLAYQDTAQQIQTQLGGVFYLWHLCAALDLPHSAADWNMPQNLGAWGVMEALARALLGLDTAHEDPIWTLLATLDGRDPGTPLGLGMQIPDTRNALAISGPFSEALGTWLGATMPAIKTRLAEALECPTETVKNLLQRPAHIDVRPAEIDVFYPMNSAELPTRRAGLDVDPGWVPALGHIVRFHYV